MNVRNRKLAASVSFLFASILACAVGTTDPTPGPIDPALSPTVNLTLTSVFANIVESASAPAEVITTTSTSTSEATSSSEVADASPTLFLVTTQPATDFPSNFPTREFAPPPSGPTRTPDPNGGPVIHPGPSVSAAYISPSPIIDGDFSDWVATTYPVNHVVYGSGYYLDANDISGTFQVGWDATHLFIGIDVIDNKFVQNTGGKWLYLGDSIEILIDSNVSGDFNDTSLNFDDHQLGISPGSSLTGGRPEAYIWFPRSKQGPTSVVEIGVQMTSQGYRIEAAIPWSLFGVFPAINQHFGFAISISDNDAAGTNWQQTMVSNVSTRRLTDPTTWGDIVLIAP